MSMVSAVRPPETYNMNLTKTALAPIAAALILIGTTARAEPALQLDILGGTYDTATQTIFATSNSFTLYAYGLEGKINLADNFYLSMALVPQTSVGGSYGSFKIDSATINVTGDMVYGTPPIETNLAHDAGDLGQHSVFSTYFTEKNFSFSSGTYSQRYDTQTNTGAGPSTWTSGNKMYYASFVIDASGLAPGAGIHFDLYNEKAKYGDTDVANFAPFSHDAQTMAIPEPETYAMLLAGLGMMGFVASRRKRKLVA